MTYPPNQPPAGLHDAVCPQCGQIVPPAARRCPHCGAYLRASEKSRLAALLLCFFLGCLGVHRFYVGKIGTGLLQLLTLGGLGIWAIVDFILIAVGESTDKLGNKVLIWLPND